ncbi:uncharacterized protein HRG_09523 [Hirsutella rhossiliensis]|uniref:Programmed cell death protein 2 C-terminal domain-containing protein n=1 Tax=Hirsutella rhossiliensis TaxID=111463 RepID=A0A9P8MT45_9HYPO|nr:uncharacterized protein HRG_09523 [Hirsutella rhossiliensis]KAH0959741.1 hypothetical protein HRG_09523 [Hirsutella rhossiliensis]
MATDYDSDSTEGDYTETNVLLGYASRDADEDAISKLGGRPDWLEAEKAPSAALARCKACGDLMVLLLQLNGELPERFPGHERRLYVLACRRHACRRKEGSVCALRGVRGTHVSEAEAPRTDSGPAGGLGDALFGGAKALGSGGNPNPFASEPASSTGNKAQSPVPALTKTFAESLTLNAPTPPSHSAVAAAAAAAAAEPWPEAAEQPKPYPTSYLSDADYETLDPTPEKVPDHARLDDADAPEPSALDREAFESAMDAAFQKFADRLAQNPDQVIRYEFAGAPLLYSKTDCVGQRLAAGASAIPGCANCGARRVFEVQLTPNAITELEAGDLSLEGMEWGTIIVGVCGRDCVPRHTAPGDAGYLEEWVGVQWEELTKQK